jgi:hypothetical protein
VGIGFDPRRVDHTHLPTLPVEIFRQLISVLPGSFQAGMRRLIGVLADPPAELFEPRQTVLELGWPALASDEQTNVKRGFGDIDTEDGLYHESSLRTLEWEVGQACEIRLNLVHASSSLGCG